MIKKIIKWLQQWDIIWSAPLAFMAFVAFAWFVQPTFGDSFGSYDPAMYQAAIYAIGITILFNGAIWVGVWFNWRSLYRYYLSEAKTDFYKLLSWQRILLLFISYWLYFLALAYLWGNLV